MVAVNIAVVADVVVIVSVIAVITVEVIVICWCYKVCVYAGQSRLLRSGNLTSRGSRRPVRRPLEILVIG